MSEPTAALLHDLAKAGDVVTDPAVLDGYRASYVTSYNNGLYGIYAFAARNPPNPALEIYDLSGL